MLLFVLLAGSFAVLRHGNPWDPAPKWIDPAWPVGIRGWLIPFAILTVLGAFAGPFTLWLHAERSGRGHMGKTAWQHPSGPLVVSGAGAVIEAALILTAYLFFTRRTSAPALFIGTRSAQVVWSFALQMYEATNPLLAKQSVITY